MDRAVLITFALSLTGCNVIKSDLLEPSDAQVDARVTGDASIDASPDAYVPYMGNLASNADLENGNTLGWANNGGSAVLANSTVQAHGGARSLLTTTRTAKWNGPGIPLNTMIRQGKTYSATAWVRTANPVTDKFYVSTRWTCAQDVDPHFNEQTNRTPAMAISTAWVQPTATFTVVTPDVCTMTSFMVYVESETITDPFYVDDIDIREMQ
jgi:endo-1,4-beta-xylanase